MAHHTHSLVKALRSVPDFAGLDDKALLKIVGASANLVFGAGSRIFEAGSPSEALYVVLSGEVRILDADGIEVARLGRGQSFGEISLLLRTEHTKTAEAVEDTELMVVPHESFEELLASNADVRSSFERRAEERQAVRGEASEAKPAR